MREDQAYINTDKEASLYSDIHEELVSLYEEISHTLPADETPPLDPDAA